MTSLAKESSGSDDPRSSTRSSPTVAPKGSSIEDVSAGVRSVAVFRRHWGIVTEGFIERQAASLRAYEAILVCVDHQTPRAEPIRAARRFSRVAELMMLAGVAPRKLRRVLEKADLVHAHFGPDAALLLRVLTRRRYRRLPLVVTFHGYDATVTDAGLRARGRLQAWFISRRSAVFERSDALIGVSEFILSRLLELGAPADKCSVHYMGTELPPEPHAQPGSTFDVVFVGRLIESKGVLDLARAVHSISSAGHDISLAVVGDGPERSRMAAILDGVNVTWFGAQHHSVAMEVVSHSRVFCGPSRTGSDGGVEGFGLTFIEAQARGVPVVGYRSGGVREAVADGETGVLVDEGDVGALTNALLQLLGDAERATAMGRAGAERVRQKFDASKQADSLERIYDSVLGQVRAR